MAGLYKRGKLWYVKYYLDGKTVRKSVSKDKKTALEYKAKLEMQISRRQLSLPVYHLSPEHRQKAVERLKYGTQFSAQ